MNIDGTHHTLLFDYKGSEFAPDEVIQYFAFKVKLNDNGFSGQTDFETTADCIKLFVQELDNFYSLLNNNPKFLAGVGDDIYFVLMLSLHDRRGNIRLDCEIKQHSLMDYFNSVHVYQIIELYQVNEIASFFRRVLTSTESETFYILPKH